ncbi:MAG: AAA family ATPase [Candidatus Eremiobacteraeota bacterium]|nr:AAA family ATPase [Candidatus Eremiobacteraeota bacterium]
MAALVLQVLGGFALSVDGVTLPNPSTKKARALFAYLALNRHTDIARDRLIERFWPDSDAIQGRDNLKTALWSVRRSLRLGNLDSELYVGADRSVVRWLKEVEIDAERFLELISLENRDADARAIALYRGDFLEGDYDNWASSQRERFSTAYETVLTRSVRSSRDLISASRLLERNPYEESAYVSLIEAELKANRLQAAVLYAERCRAALAEVGDKPSSEFETRFGSLHRHSEGSGEAVLPFTGREAELALIENLCERVQQQRGSLMLVHGDAGIGKSAVTQRVIEISARRGLKARTLRGVAGDSRPFGPWQELFTEQMLANVVASATLGDAIPAILVVEDVHALTRDAFHLTLEIARKNTEHLIILTSRPEGVGNLRDGLKGLNYREAPLQPLQRDELEQALRSATGVHEPELLNALWERSRGHPYFASSLFSALVQRGVLVRERSTWLLAKALTSAIEMPTSLKRFIELRLQSRGEHAPMIASALGLDPAATADDLISVLAINEALVLDALDDLLALGLLVESTENSSFSFAHDLVREVAVSMLNLARRTSLHRAFGVRLEGQSGENVMLRRARHLRDSGQTLQSAECYMRAAADAVAWNAFGTARELVDEARVSIERLMQSSARDSTLSKLGAFSARLKLMDGDAEGALVLASQAGTLARAAGNDIELARVFLIQAHISGVAFQPDAQGRYVDHAFELSEQRGARDLQAAALVQRAQAMRLMGRADDCIAASQAAYDIARSCNDWASANRATEEGLRAELTWWRFGEATTTANRAFDESSQTEMLGHASLLQTRAALWFLLERYDAAQVDLEDAERLTGEVDRRHSLLGDPLHSVVAVRFAGDCLYAFLGLKLSRAHHESFAAIERMQASPLNRIGAFSRLVALTNVEALLARDGPGDVRRARELTSMLPSNSPVGQSYLGWSACPELAKARIAARLARTEAPAALRRALNAVEQNARATPLTADHAFDQLAIAASEAQDELVRVRAKDRARTFHRARTTAADGIALI